MEELQEYAQQQSGSLRDLSEDELDQVAAGKGISATVCVGFGIGLGYSDNGDGSGGACIGIGYGNGPSACTVKGVGKCITDGN